MKQFTFLFVLFLLANTAYSAILTLNNNNPSPGQYTTWDAVQAAANNGDTILVHGSPINYSVQQVILTKSLTLIGPGHRPNTTGNLSAIFDGIIIGGSNLSNIRLIGLRIISNGINSNASPSNVTVENCSITGAIQFNGNNWSFKNCIIQGEVNLNNGTQTNLTFTNNYFSNSSGGPNFNNFGGTGNKLVTNNIFAWSGAGAVFTGNVTNTIFENNIFYGTTPNSGNQTNCVYNNNLSYLTNNNTLPPAGQSGSNNQAGVDPQFENVFVPPASSAFNYTSNYRLKAGSPGLGAGTNGTNLGLYESDNVFTMTGEPARPQTINVAINPASIPAGGSTQVNFTIRKSTTEQ